MTQRVEKKRHSRRDCFQNKTANCVGSDRSGKRQRDQSGGVVSNQCTLIVARNVLTDETKYFLSNRVAG